MIRCIFTCIFVTFPANGLFDHKFKFYSTESHMRHKCVSWSLESRHKVPDFEAGSCNQRTYIVVCKINYEIQSTIIMLYQKSSCELI